MTDEEVAELTKERDQLALRLAEAVGLMRQTFDAIDQVKKYYYGQKEREAVSNAKLMARVQAANEACFQDVVKELEPFLHIPEIYELLWGKGNDGQPRHR